MTARVKDPDVRGPRTASGFLKLLRGRGVYDARDGGHSLVSFRSVHREISPRGVHAEKQARNFGDERAFGVSYMARTFASNRRRHLQLVASSLKKSDMVNLIQVDEVRERVGVSWWKNQGKYTTTDY